MGVEENKKIAQADIMNSGKAKLADRLELYDTNPTIWDSVIGVMGYSGSNTVSGAKAVKDFLTWLANLPPIQAKIVGVIGEGDKVSVEWMLSGGEGAQKFEIPCVNLYDFKNSKIKSVRMHFDSNFFAKLAGK
jgi:hypothetical protein